jgi:DNA-binding YbaB/EbfC family protein
MFLMKVYWMRLDMTPNLEELMKQAQQVQQRMEAVQREMVDARVVGESGAGLVKITLNGRCEAVALEIDPSLKSESIQVLQDLIVSAINDAVQRVEQRNVERVSELTSGMDLGLNPSQSPFSGGSSTPIDPKFNDLRNKFNP